jgi:alpha-L-arabinofuranosidase
MDELPQVMASFIDYIDYANGSTLSKYGRLRAADGHRKPYRLKYLELGNEEAINEDYWRKFKPIAEAIWEKDSEIILVVGDFAYDRVIQDPYNFSGAPRIRSLAAHKKILDLAKEHDREVWFDVHIGTEQPPAPNGLPGVRSFIEQLGKLSPGAKFKVAIFEFNANNHSLKRALANALAVNQIERFCPEVAISCSANCLQPWHQNDNGWNQGLLFFTLSQVWPQPPYFVIQMLSRNLRPMLLNAEVHCPERSLDVTATRDEHGGAVSLQVVNMRGSAVPARIRLEGLAPRKSKIHVTTLAGDLEAFNTPEEPHRIKPVEQDCAGSFENGTMTYDFVPRSFTVLRFN